MNSPTASAALQMPSAIIPISFVLPFGGRRPAVSPHRPRTRPRAGHVECYRLRLERPPAAAIEHNVAQQIRGGDVILLHDGGHDQMGADRSQTLTATDHLIARYKMKDTNS